PAHPGSRRASSRSTAEPVLTHPGDRPTTNQSLGGDAHHLQLEPTEVAASTARQEIRGILDGAGVSPATAADIELVVAELLTNAVEQEPDQPVEVRLALTDRSVSLSVANRIREPASLPPPEAAAEPVGELADRGWGLQIVAALTDGLWFDNDHEWTRVTCICRLDRAGPAGPLA
ncbi:MAG: ATP-binding protein, partial [Actinomycetota bacterium]